jgi:glycerol-3-phosphate dehydrogenase
MYFYGSDKEQILNLVQENDQLGERLHASYPHIQAEVVWAVRNEMARTPEDFLARRIRMLFMDARAAMDMVPVVAEIMAVELDKDDDWIEEQIQAFLSVAKNYILEDYKPEYAEPTLSE